MHQFKDVFPKGLGRRTDFCGEGFGAADALLDLAAPVDEHGQVQVRSAPYRLFRFGADSYIFIFLVPRESLRNNLLVRNHTVNAESDERFTLVIDWSNGFGKVA